MIDRDKFEEFIIENEIEMWNRYSEDLISTYGNTKEVLEIININNTIISNLLILDQKLTKLVKDSDRVDLKIINPENPKGSLLNIYFSKKEWNSFKLI